MTKFTVQDGEAKMLGDLATPKPSAPYKPPTIAERIESALNVSGTPLERLDRVKDSLRVINQHLLIALVIETIHASVVS